MHKAFRAGERKAADGPFVGIAHQGKEEGLKEYSVRVFYEEEEDVDEN